MLINECEWVNKPFPSWVWVRDDLLSGMGIDNIKGEARGGIRAGKG